MPTTSIFEWYGDECLVKLKNMGHKALEAVANQVEAQTKVNIAKPFEHKDGSVRGQIDTGNMLNSVRAITESGVLPFGIETAVEVGAEYAPYQEDIRPFLYPAVEEVAAGFEGSIGNIGEGAL